jgi:hypothetical protein
MNQYGKRAQLHWQQWRPQEYSQITDPEGFFTELGEQAQTQINDLQITMAGEDPPGETYLDKVGRLNMARMRAEEAVMADLLLEPETGTDQDEEDPEDEADLPETGQEPTEIGPGQVIEPGHPLYEEIHAEHQRLNPDH